MLRKRLTPMGKALLVAVDRLQGCFPVDFEHNRMAGTAQSQPALTPLTYLSFPKVAA